MSSSDTDLTGWTIEIPATSPSACGLAIAMPRTREDFERSIDEANGLDTAWFYKKFAASWEHYVRIALPPPKYVRMEAILEGVAESVARRGVAVEFPCGLNGVERLARDRSVVTVIGHSPPGGLQLMDGVYAPKALAERLPGGFQGRLDLMTCKNAEFGRTLRALVPGLLGVGVATREIEVVQAALVYQQVIELIHREPMEYFAARALVQTQGLESGGGEEKTR
jgi:hypothetical protein